MTNLTVFFFIKKDRIDIAGQVPVYCRLRTSGSSISFSTGESVDYERWNKTDHLKDSRIPEEKAVRRRLADHEERIHYDWRIWQSKKPSLNLHDFRTYLQDGSVHGDDCERLEQDSIRHLFDLHLSRVRMKVETGENSLATLEKVERCLRHTMEMIKEKYVQDDFRLSKLNLAFVEDLFHYFRTVRNQDQNTAIKHVEFVRSAIRTGIAHDLLPKDPFSAFRKRKKEVQRNFLNDEQIKRIEEYDFHSARLDLVRDLFVVGIYTGYSYIDITQLSIEHVVEKGNGRLFLNKKRVKTANSVAAPCEVPLLPPVERLISKYRNDPRCKKNRRLFPCLTNQTLNSYLKEIQDICHIPFNLHFHLSRHTFSTTITLAKGVSMEVVARMLGHKRLTSTQHYARLVEQRVINETDSLYSIYK